MPRFIRYEILTNTSDGHNKFWSYISFGSTMPDGSGKSVLITHWGKIGTAGQTKVEFFNTAISTNPAVSKKKNEGYKVTVIPRDGKSEPLSDTDAKLILQEFFDNHPSAGNSAGKADRIRLAFQGADKGNLSDATVRNFLPIFTNALASISPMGKSEDRTKPKPPPVIPEPKIDRETVYDGGWGGF